MSQLPTAIETELLFDADSFMVGQFLEAIRAFDGRVPRLRSEVDRLNILARSLARAITEWEIGPGYAALVEALGKTQDLIRRSFYASDLGRADIDILRDLISDVIKGDEKGDSTIVNSISNFIEEARREGIPEPEIVVAATGPRALPTTTPTPPSRAAAAPSAPRPVAADVSRPRPAPLDGPIDPSDVLKVRGVTDARLETILRNNTMTAFNEGRARTLEQRGTQDIVPLAEIRAIRDRRTRGNPAGLYPDDGYHFQMNGYVNTMDNLRALGVVPPCGHNCRCTIRGIPAAEARSRGFMRSTGQVDMQAINRFNGDRQRIIDAGLYPDPGWIS